MEAVPLEVTDGGRIIRIGAYSFYSQDPSFITSNPTTLANVRAYLPGWVRIWQAIERVTGHRWKCTSYIRDSFSHKEGWAIDLAPDFDREANRHYAVTRGSDPVLYKRAALYRALQQLVMTDFFGPSLGVRTGIYIESDHLHIQVNQIGTGEAYPTSIIKWKAPKPIYSDTYQRMAGLGML